MKKALIIGSTVCDIIIRVHELPKISGDENIISQKMQLGGCAYNVAHILKQCHIPFDLLSPVGTGIYGSFVENHLCEEDIPIMIHSNKDNGCCYCIVDDSSERTFICEHGTEYFYQEDYFKILDNDKYDSIYICGLEIEETTGHIIIDFLENHKDKMIYFAPGPRLLKIDENKMQRIFALHPIMHLNKQEICTYTKQNDLQQALIALYALTHNVIIVTLGKQGCYYFDGQEGYLIASKPTNIESSVGAGDSHIGGIMAYRKMGYSWHDTLTKANEVALEKLSQKS